MPSNIVKNEMEDVQPEGVVFNDEQILQDVLSSLKHLLTEYGLLQTEASNQELASTVEQAAKQVGTMTRDSFNLMFKKGWYTLEKAETTKIKKEYDKLNKKLNECNE